MIHCILTEYHDDYCYYYSNKKPSTIISSDRGRGRGRGREDRGGCEAGIGEGSCGFSSWCPSLWW